MGFERSDSALYLTSQLAKGLARALQKRAAALGFSPGQFPVLLALWHEDGLTQRQLLDRMEVEQATLANTLARMERDGLILRRPHPSDRRAQIISLSDRGRELEQMAIEAAAQADDEVFAGFRRFERELLMEYMRMAIANARSTERA
jgi:DNA-binding MarR family transcriptional regulator